MQVKQIYGFINDWIAEQTAAAKFDETEQQKWILNEDLSNIVDIGTAVYNTGWVDNFVKSMIDRIGRMVFVDRRTRGFAPDIQRNGWEFGSVLSKTRIKRFEAKANPSWQLTKGQTVNQFEYNPPEASTKYYNLKIAWQIDCSFAEMQVKEAFTSAMEMNRFMSAIESTIGQSLDDQMEALTMRAINGFMAEKIYANEGGVVDLLTPYNTETSSSLTLDSMTQSEDWNRYAAYQILLCKDRLKARTSVFNNNEEAGYDTATPGEFLHFVLHNDIARAIDVYLNAQTFHNDFSDIGAYDVVPMWQASGSNFQRSITTQIDIGLPSNINRPPQNAVTLKRNGIIGLMFDYDAIVINNENQRVTSSYNANGEYFNNFYKVDTNILIDMNENGIVFVAGTGAAPQITLDKSTATVVEEATTSLTATVVPSGSAVTWSSSDEETATVSSGTVTGVAAGTADIYATITVDGIPYTAACTVTVTAKPEAEETKKAKK